MIIKAAKRIFNSDKICSSYSDLNFGVTFFGTQCIMYMYVCMYACIIKPWHRKLIFDLPVHLEGTWVSLIWRSSGQEQGLGQKRTKSVFPQCETSISNNSCFIECRAVKSVCSMGFMDMADWMVWPPSWSRDQKWPRICWQFASDYKRVFLFRVNSDCVCKISSTNLVLCRVDCKAAVANGLKQICCCCCCGCCCCFFIGKSTEVSPFFFLFSV